MNPIVRIACFLIFIIGLATGDRIFYFLPILLILCQIYCHFIYIFPLIKRLRWFFLFLFVLNVWFNSPEWAWIPSWHDIWLAMEQIIALIMMVLAAHLLMITTRLQDIIAALLWWLKPLSIVKISTEKLAIRLALVLDTVQKVNHLYDNIHVQTNLANIVIALFTTVLELANTEPLRVLEIPELPKPPIWQWLIPILLILIVIFI